MTVKSTPLRYELQKPLEALREAVVNALMHRDYMVLGNIEIRVYNDQLIISNPGSLPEEMTLEDLKKPRHASIKRNPLLAQTFYYTGLVERWGTGTARLTQACLEHGLPEPEFEVSSQQFTVIFRKDLYSEERLRELGLNARQLQAVFHVKEYGSIDNATHQEKFGISKRTATRDLKDLEERDLFERIGTVGRGTVYTLK